MNPFLIYAVKVVLISGVATAYYYLALRNKLFHHWNRFYLLLTVLLSLLLPFIKVNWWQPVDDRTAVIRMLQTVQGDEEIVVFAKGTSTTLLSPGSWAWMGYTIISFVLLLLFIHALISLWKLMRNMPFVHTGTIRLYHTQDSRAPFSFFRNIFWHKAIDIQSSNGQQILKHEMVHVDEGHSWDKLFVQFATTFSGSTPFFWLLQRELRIVHEFIADRKAIEHGDLSQFAAMMLTSAYPSHAYAFTNSFFHQSLKRRIAMLQKISNPSISYISRVLCLPLIVLIAAAFTLKPVWNKTVPDHGNSSYLQNEKNFITDMIPTYAPMDKNIKALKKVEEQSVELTYKNGTTNPEHSNKIATIQEIDTTKKPLLLINGEEFPYRVLNLINPKDIETMNVLKGESAIAKWGEKGKQGVIEVMLKPGVKAPSKDIHYPDTPKGRVIVFDSIYKDKNGNATMRNLRDPSLDRELTFTKTEVPPQFTGGTNAWREFLKKNLKAATPVDNGAPAGTYSVIVQFIVNLDGTLEDIKPLTSHSFGMEEEVLRIMKLSPPWMPALQNGKNVKAYHKQTITFIVSSEEKEINTSVSSLPKLTVKQLQTMPFSKLVQPDTNYDQVSGAFSMDVNGGDIGETWFKTDKWTNEQIRKLIAKAQPGNTIIIDRRTAFTKEGKEIKLPALVYYIN